MQTLRQFRSILPYMRPYWKQAIAALLAVICSSGTMLAIGQGIRAFIDGGVENSINSTTLSIIVLLAISTSARICLVSWIGEKATMDLRQQLFEKILCIGPPILDRLAVGDLLNRLTTETATVQGAFGGSLSSVLRNLCILIGAMIMMAWTNPVLFVSASLILPAIILPMRLLALQTKGLARKAQERFGEAVNFAEECINALNTVQAFNQQQGDAYRFYQRSKDAFQASLRRSYQRAIMVGLSMLLSFGGITGLFWVGNQLVAMGALNMGELGAFMFYAGAAALSSTSLTEAWGDLARASVSMERILAILNHQPSHIMPSRPMALPPASNGRSIRFENVHFHYPNNQKALRGFTLEIPSGKTIALVGPSGGGKSTAFSLILRTHDPHIGRITLDGIDLKNIDPMECRDTISIVSQQTHLFSTTIAENIRYSKPSASREEIEHAATLAHADGFIKALPMGYDTPLDSKGMQLSGGQRQRLSIARALLRNSPVLLLDEATSALDAASEALVQDAMERLQNGRTTLIIAHRLATVIRADAIALVEDGQVTAFGSHRDLFQSNPLYTKMATLQFRNNVEDHR